ncbi:ATP-binding cassette sub-family D member 2 [Eumeta japonica]|uniref:ATP-binding cassette sub-family D member 2 n=1 Tax=Eumeta variegata TaxID=151549 RepID=A0A4C1T289_EUMVA|nr:ATP-binding cassette sub-family D member 2 [Eumeta japonica]
MGVFSKYVDRAADKLEQAGLPKAALSHILVACDSKNNNRVGKNHGALTPPQTEISDDDEHKLAEAEKLLVEKQMKNKKNQNMLEPGLNKEFIKQLVTLLKIMIPKPLCYETGLLSVHTLCLISRTFLSIYVAALEGAIVKYIVRRDVRQFSLVLLKWFGIAIPATFVNSMIRFLESKLSLAFSERTQYLTTARNLLIPLPMLLSAYVLFKEVVALAGTCRVAGMLEVSYLENMRNLIVETTPSARPFVTGSNLRNGKS